jgi:single-stranded DNA-binding protein
MSLNHVVLVGTCAAPSPTLTYNAASAKPECKLTLIVSDGKGEQTFNLYVPVFVYGANAERVAEEVEAGDLIAVDGRLAWKSTLKKDGSKLGLCVTTFAVEVLVQAAEGEASAPELAPAPDLPPDPVAEPKKGKPRYAKWRPEPMASQN